MTVVSNLGIAMSGDELRGHRKKVGLSQIKLAKLAGVHRCAVLYWERKLFVDPRHNAPKQFLRILNLPFHCKSDARAWGFTDHQQDALDKKAEKETQKLLDCIVKKQSRARVRCGAKTRAGHPCKHKSEHGRRRCKFHGGMSTGPRTLEGRERIAIAQRLRWKRYRQLNAADSE